MAGRASGYSVKLVGLSFEEKQNYDQIVFDRVPTLATEIKTSAMKDLLVFFRRKTSSSVLSKRTLPRIPLHCTLETADGRSVHIRDYNYQYMSIAGSVPFSEFCVRVGNATLQLKKTKGSIGGKDNLFEVENWKSISVSDEVYEAISEFLRSEQNEKRELQNV